MTRPAGKRTYLSIRTCPACLSRATKIFSLDTGKLNCQVCHHRYPVDQRNFKVAYSDYGGFGYLDGTLIIDRSDVVLTPEGLKSTPGMWPGWVMNEGREGGSYHVVIGDADVLVCLYKQSSFTIIHNGKTLDPVDVMAMEDKGEFTTRYAGKDNEEVWYVDTDALISAERIARFEVGEYVLEMLFEISDNHYQYARLTQPDGKVWTAFAGYGVGAGLEDGGHGYSTQKQIERLQEVFP